MTFQHRFTGNEQFIELLYGKCDSLRNDIIKTRHYQKLFNNIDNSQSIKGVRKKFSKLLILH